MLCSVRNNILIIDIGFRLYYLCADMFKKYNYIVIAALLIVFQANAQIRPTGSGNSRQIGSRNSNSENSENPSDTESTDKKEKKKIPSVIKVWQVDDQGSLIRPAELDTTLWFYHNYLPFNQVSISNTFTGNNGGAYISNDFFKRTSNSDFYFARSFDAYWLNPSQIRYYNTTTPYSLLDYSQSENRMTHNETRFNVFHSQNINKNLNFEFIYNQTRSSGQYQNQENKFHSIGLVTSYRSDRFLSHSNIIFNRLQGQENGGIDEGQSFDGIDTDYLTVKISDDAINKLQNNNVLTINEYRVGKTIESEADTSGFVTKTFIPRVGFIHEFEFSDNKRKFTKENSTDFFDHVNINGTTTNDSVKYSRLTNIFQIKFYEAPDRKFTFGKRAFIGYDNLWYHSSTQWHHLAIRYMNTPTQFSNTFIGGGIFRDEGKFWQWEAEGKIYFAGYRSGQTELSGFINKPMKIGRDTTSLRIEGSLKTLVPEYFDQYFYSNHFEWRNNFNNINEMTIRSSIHSQAYKTTIGANYSLIGNYIYNNTRALPAQASSELLILSAYLNKDFDSRHWLIRTQLLVQKGNKDRYLHLPAFAGFMSINYRTVWSKVLFTQLGIDTRYNSAFYADAYEPATARFYLQNRQRIGNFPYIDLHANLKLKRTRFFFILMNAASGFAGDNYFVAPDYPNYRRTFRLGVAWSFYD
ncbi:MAG: hypothetical protein C0397_18910 [Odoribacter sp.]|nr:hypothetical protein [Odoribacter sp.]